MNDQGRTIEKSETLVEGHVFDRITQSRTREPSVE